MKAVALWNFENEYEGKVKKDQEIELTEERYRELRVNRLVIDKKTWDARNPAPKKVKEEKAAEKAKTR